MQQMQATQMAVRKMWKKLLKEMDIDIQPSYYDALEKLKRPNLRSEFDKLLKKIEQRIPRVCKPIRTFNSKTKIVDQLYEAGSDLDGGYRIYWKSKVGQLKTSKPVVLWCGLKKTQASDVKIAFDLISKGN